MTRREKRRIAVFHCEPCRPFRVNRHMNLGSAHVPAISPFAAASTGKEESIMAKPFVIWSSRQLAAERHGR